MKKPQYNENLTTTTTIIITTTLVAFGDPERRRTMPDIGATGKHGQHNGVNRRTTKG